jgi:hypothetical protein
MIRVAVIDNDRLVPAGVLYLYGTGSTLAATARRLNIAIPTVRSYLDRIRAKWAAADEPVPDLRALVEEYLPPQAGTR